MSATRAGVFRWLRIAAGLVLLVVLVRTADLSELSLRWSGRLALAALAAIGLLATAQGLSALRWKILLGDGAPPWPYLFRLYLIAAFFSLFLPTAVGGDAVRAAAASRSLGNPSQVVATVLADRILGVVALVTYLVVGLIVVGVPPGLGLTSGAAGRLAAIAAAGLVAVVALGYLFRGRLGPVLRFVGGVVSAIRLLATNPRQLGLGLVVGFAVQAVYLVAWIALARGLELPIPTESFLVTVPLVSLSTMAPITLSGVGIREGAWIVLLGPYGIASANALALSLLYFGCWMLVAASGGVLFAWRGTSREP